MSGSFAKVVPSPDAPHEPDPGKADDDDAANDDQNTLVQFTTAIYFVEESEKFLTIDLMRLGSMKGTISVNYYTEDGSAKAGLHYESIAGEVTFKDDEFRQSIRVSTIASPYWSPTLEFKVHLCKPSGAALGRYLRTCRVKVIDSDTFPSSKYESQLLRGKQGVSEIRTIGLLWEYWKLCFLQLPGIGKRSCLVVLLDQFRNAYRVILLALNMYMVDVLFNTANPDTEKQLIGGSRQDTAIFIAAAWLLPMVAIHLAAALKARMDLPGHLRLYLQRCLFRKYLNYSEESRASVAPADMQNAIVRDSGGATGAYTKLLDLIGIIAELIVFTYFTISSNITAVWFVIAMPSCMAIYFGLVYRCRGRVDQWKEAEALVLRIVWDACNRYRLVADYFQRPQMNEAFSVASGSLRTKFLRKHTADVHDDMFPKWLGPFFIALYIIIDSRLVLDGKITLGTFLATISILSSISDQFSRAYSTILDLQEFCAPMKKLTVYFNKETDLLMWKKVNRQRRENTKKERDALLAQPKDATPGSTDDGKVAAGAYKTDLIPIRMDGISYTHHGKTIFTDVTVQAQQGQLVAVTGPHGSGKATLLRLLGHVVFPQEGSIFIPSHLRVLHVTQEALMLNSSPWRNLLFGCPDTTLVDANRVRLILEMMEMKATLSLIEEDLLRHAKGAEGEESPKNSSTYEDAGTWLDGLTYTEKVKLHLSRALIMNPEVIVLQRPLHHYDYKTSKLVMDVLKAHVRERGLGLPEEGRPHRRPRTCFFTVEDVSQAEQADVAWHIQDQTVITNPVA